MRGPVLTMVTATREMMARQHDGVLIVREDILDVLSEGSPGSLHRFLGKVIQPLCSAKRTG